jgi:hypothetical protein
VYRGRAVLGEAGFYFRSVVCEDFIATVVSDEEYIGDMQWGVRRIGDAGHEAQSGEVRRLVLERLGALVGEESELRIGKNSWGCPVVLRRDKEMGIPVSLAHHGRYIGYSLQLGQGRDRD